MIQQNGHPFISIMLEYSLGRDRDTSRYEAMGTNSKVQSIEEPVALLEVEQYAVLPQTHKEVLC